MTDEERELNDIREDGDIDISEGKLEFLDEDDGVDLGSDIEEEESALGFSFSSERALDE